MQRSRRYGGDTLFASQYGAFGGLRDGLKAMIEPLQCASVLTTSALMIYTHPVLKLIGDRPNLTLTSAPKVLPKTSMMSVEESRPLLNYLIEQGSKPDLTMRHSWEAGDIVMWDNRCVMHYAVHDYGDMPREMHRVTIG